MALAVVLACGRAVRTAIHWLTAPIRSKRFRTFRPRSDEAHLPHQHVEQLRQFVEMKASQDVADRRDPRVAGHAPARAGEALTLVDHGANLENREGAAGQANALAQAAETPTGTVQSTLSSAASGASGSSSGSLSSWLAGLLSGFLLWLYTLLLPAFADAGWIGRGFIESLRIDEAHHFFGVRLNVFTAIVVALGALLYIVVSARVRPGRETPAELDPRTVASVTSSTDDAVADVDDTPEPDPVVPDAPKPVVPSSSEGDSVDP